MSRVTAFVFPGQGSQALGMLAGHAAGHSLIQKTFTEASAALGYDLWGLIQNGTKEQLDQTQVTQPAILAASIALWRVWRAERGVVPGYLAGHSLGEYSALVAAGSLEFAAALRLVEMRGTLMQEAVPAGQGAMAAILGLSDAEVMAACAQAAQGAIVSAVNFNAPGQVVIAGNTSAVERAIELCKASGAKRAMSLPISVPSHSLLMKPAAERFSDFIESIVWKPPQIPLVQNVTAAPVTGVSDVKANLLAQLYSPVRWVESMQRLAAEGVTDLVECGPGRVLSGLNKRCVDGVTTYNLDTPDVFMTALSALNQ